MDDRAAAKPPHAGNGAPDGATGIDLPSRDVRRKRPPGLSLLLRLETVRRIVRVLSLLVLDWSALPARCSRQWRSS